MSTLICCTLCTYAPYKLTDGHQLCPKSQWLKMKPDKNQHPQWMAVRAVLCRLVCFCKSAPIT